MRHYKIVKSYSDKLDEGLFKEVEKTIIDQDDPDYVRKDRERMFNNFKMSDFKKKTSADINKFLQNVFSQTVPEEGKNYDIVYKQEGDTITPIINVTNTNVIILPINWNVLLSPHPTPEDYKTPNPIPFKFGKVVGSFTCSACNLKSLKNCPDEVAGDFVCNFNNLTDMDFIPHAYNFILKNNNLDIKVINKILQKNPELDMKFSTDNDTMRTYYPDRTKTIDVTGNRRLYQFRKSSRYKEILKFEDI